MPALTVVIGIGNGLVARAVFCRGRSFGAAPILRPNGSLASQRFTDSMRGVSVWRALMAAMPDDQPWESPPGISLAGR
jgi:hypothetical protein